MILKLNMYYTNKQKNNMSTHPDFRISNDIKVKIINEIIEPFYIYDISSKIRAKKCWKRTGQIFETSSKLLVAIGGIISFSSGYFQDPLLSFFAGAISTLSLATLQFSSFAYSENKKQGQELNILLKKLDIDTVPVVEQQLNFQRRSNSISSATAAPTIEEEEISTHQQHHEV